MAELKGWKSWLPEPKGWKSWSTWICEMTGEEINLRQSEKMALLLEVSDEALEAACGGLGGSPTLAYASYLLHLFCVRDGSRRRYLSANERWS
jgi:hypothetical protein